MAKSALLLVLQTLFLNISLTNSLRAYKNQAGDFMVFFV